MNEPFTLFINGMSFYNWGIMNAFFTSETEGLTLTPYLWGFPLWRPTFEGFPGLVADILVAGRAPCEASRAAAKPSTCDRNAIVIFFFTLSPNRPPAIESRSPYFCLFYRVRIWLWSIMIDLTYPWVVHLKWPGYRFFLGVTVWPRVEITGLHNT